MNLSATFGFIAVILMVMGLGSWGLTAPLVTFILLMGGFAFAIMALMISMKELKE